MAYGKEDLVAFEVVVCGFCEHPIPKRFATRLSDEEYFCDEAHLMRYLDELNERWRDTPTTMIELERGL